jgi:hypothetical protein
MTDSKIDLDDLAKKLEENFEAVKGYIDRGFEEVVKRLEALEATPMLRDAGVWASGKQYGPGAVVTHGGSAWVAERPTLAQPGGPDDGWRLLVKRGKDLRA